MTVVCEARRVRVSKYISAYGYLDLTYVKVVSMVYV